MPNLINGALLNISNRKHLLNMIVKFQKTYKTTKIILKSVKLKAQYGKHDKDMSNTHKVLVKITYWIKKIAHKIGPEMQSTSPTAAFYLLLKG